MCILLELYTRILLRCTDPWTLKVFHYLLFNNSQIQKFYLPLQSRGVFTHKYSWRVCWRTFATELQISSDQNESTLHNLERHSTNSSPTPRYCNFQFANGNIANNNDNVYFWFGGDSNQLHIGVILKQLMVAQLVNKFHAPYGSRNSLPIFPLSITNPHNEPEESNHIQMSKFLQFTLVYSSYECENYNAAEFRFMKCQWWQSC